MQKILTEPRQTVAKPVMEETRETCCVGIDLGTSRSSISASNGERYVIDSYVGWLLDPASRKLVKNSVLVGREALDSRSMLDLRRPLVRGLIKEASKIDEEAVQEILRRLISQIGLPQKSKATAKVRAVVGVPAEAFRYSKQRLRKAIEGIAENVMLVSESVAVAYGLEALLHALIIDIGAATADFCVLRGRYPIEEDQRTLTSAGDSIDEHLLKLLREHYPEAQTSIHTIRGWKEKWSFVGKPNKRVVVTSRNEAFRAMQLDITAEMRAACESILPALTQTMLDLLATVEPEYQENVRNNIILAGGTSLISGLNEAIQKTLSDLGGGRVTTVKDPVFAGSDGGLAIARDASSSDWEKLSL